jgi:hypothetical protein
MIHFHGATGSQSLAVGPGWGLVLRTSRTSRRLSLLTKVLCSTRV